MSLGPRGIPSYFELHGLCQINNVDITNWTVDLPADQRKIVCRTGYHYSFDFRDWSIIEITYPGVDKAKLTKDGEFTIPGYNSAINYKEWKCIDKHQKRKKINEGGAVEWVRIQKHIWPKNEKDGPSGKKGEPELPLDVYQNCILITDEEKGQIGSNVVISI